VANALIVSATNRLSIAHLPSQRATCDRRLARQHEVTMPC
jgi:hypothetical protein